MSAQTVTDSQQTGLDLHPALPFEEHDPEQNGSEPVAEPDQQQRPVSSMIKPQPEEYKVPKIQIAPEGRMVRAIDIPSQNTAVQTSSDWVIDEAIAVHGNLVPGLADAISVFDVTVIESQILPAPNLSGARQSHLSDHGKID